MGKSASKEFSGEVLKAHNDYRKKHGVPGLKLCNKLCKEAEQYSQALASTRVLKHSSESSRGQCGENLAWASYDQPGHFTAMVWKNTKKMGVGKATASDGSTFVVARYFPAGNITNQGYFEENVLPPKK
uniref:GLI pathogenesis-related 2, like n=1 Tax=Callorhinchus milii TaxID=7868 RepID=A0A4W3JX65_CALMI